MVLSGLTGAADNVVSRFHTVTVLRDQGLITPDEFRTRRRANIGALLPLSSPPPATGLDRPVPGTEQVSGRLRAIGRALEMRAISVSQHAAERTMILDALMPAAPVSVVNPGRPPQGLLEAADAVRRLEQLKGGGYISADEYTKERNAIERAQRHRAGHATARHGGAQGGGWARRGQDGQAIGTATGRAFGLVSVPKGGRPRLGAVTPRSPRPFRGAQARGRQGEPGPQGNLVSADGGTGGKQPSGNRVVP